jgi:dienelactone hydrolase
VPDLFYGSFAPILYFTDANRTGDPIPLDAPEDLSIMSWLKGTDSTPGHLPPRVDPVVSSVIAALRSEYKVERLGGVGYYFGAKYVTRFLRQILDSDCHLDAGFVAHPSFVTAEELQGISGPLSIAAAANDQVFPPEKRRETETILGSTSVDGKSVAWQMVIFGGVDHGFAVRCDVADPQQKFAMDQAFRQAISWFGEFL